MCLHAVYAKFSYIKKNKKKKKRHDTPGTDETKIPQLHETSFPAPQQPKGSGDAKCTEIKFSLDLEDVLDQVDTPYEIMSSHLFISWTTYIELKHTGRLSVFTIAQAYYDEHPKACWEDIIRSLCKRFRKNRLSSDTAERHSIPWSHSRYCN